MWLQLQMAACTTFERTLAVTGTILNQLHAKFAAKTVANKLEMKRLQAI